MKTSLCSTGLAALLLSKPTVAHPDHEDGSHGPSRAQIRRETDDLLHKGINALGGQEALSTLKSYSISAM